MLINIYENVLAFMPVVLQIAINIECGSKATYENQSRRYLHRKVKNSKLVLHTFVVGKELLCIKE